VIALRASYRGREGKDERNEYQNFFDG